MKILGYFFIILDPQNILFPVLILRNYFQNVSTELQNQAVDEQLTRDQYSVAHSSVEDLENFDLEGGLENVISETNRRPLTETGRKLVERVQETVRAIRRFEPRPDRQETVTIRVESGRQTRPGRQTTLGGKKKKIKKTQKKKKSQKRKIHK